MTQVIEGIHLRNGFRSLLRQSTSHCAAVRVLKRSNATLKHI